MNTQDDMDDIPACPYCGAMAGACDAYPNCPNGPNPAATDSRYFIVTAADGQGNFLIADDAMKLGDLIDLCGDGKSCAISVQEYPGMTAEQYEQLGDFDGF